ASSEGRPHGRRGSAPRRGGQVAGRGPLLQLRASALFLCEPRSYVEQVRAWFARFPSECFLFVKSEQFFADPEAQIGRVLRFVGLPPKGAMWPRAVNMGRYPSMDRDLRESLTEYYDPYNRQLAELLGPDFSW